MDCSYRTGTKGFHSTKKGNENDNSLKVSGFLPNLHLEESLYKWVQKTTCKWKGVKCPLSLKGFDSEWCSAKLEAYKKFVNIQKNYQKCEIKLIETSPEERIDLLLEKFIFSTVKQLDRVNSIYNIHISPVLYSTSHTQLNDYCQEEKYLQATSELGNGHACWTFFVSFIVTLKMVKTWKMTLTTAYKSWLFPVQNASTQAVHFFYRIFNLNYRGREPL